MLNLGARPSEGMCQEGLAGAIGVDSIPAAG
jgi:hypothetical protein